MRFETAKALAQARSYSLCEGCGATGAPLDAHHRITRGSGGVHGSAAAVSNNPSNLLMLCRTCHDLTLNDAPACIKLGWVIERRASTMARYAPAKIHTVNGYGWWFLLPDGTYQWADELNLTPEYLLNYDVSILKEDD
jgi:hypothetical protein